MRHTRVVGVFILCGTLMGCQTLQDMKTNKKQTGGTLIGAALGGFLGAQFGSGTGKLAATALGVVAGGWLGSELGKSLDRADRAAIDQRSAQALSKARDGETISWRNPRSGARARITPSRTRKETRKVAVLRRNNVAPIPALDLIGEKYVARRNVTVRATPAKDAAVTMRLTAGEPFEAVGKVQGRNWIVVAKNRRTVGYVYAPLVEKAPAAVALDRPSPQLETVRQVVNLDDIQNDTAIDMDAEGLVGQEVVAKAECRTMKVRIANRAGKSEQDSYKACKSADGAWEVI